MLLKSLCYTCVTHFVKSCYKILYDMKKIYLCIIHNRRGQGTTKKPVSVEIRFTCGRERRYYSTGVKVCVGNWSNQSQRVVKCVDADVLNERIEICMNRAREVVNMFLEDDSLVMSQIPSLMDGQGSVCMDFPSYCEDRAAKRDVCDNTRERYMVFVRFLRAWKHIVSFSDAANPSKIRDMNEYLHKQGKKQSTIYDYHKYMKLFINDACTDGLIKINPYDNLSFKIPRGEKQYVDCINEEQFEKLKNLHLSTPHLERVRDLFLFQCYTAMAFSDLMAFDYDNCEEIDGKMFYHSKRTKTDTDFVFVILEPAVQILKKYDYKLPKVSNQKYNDYLKAIGMMIGVDGMHSHMGRATAATLFLSKGMQINVVAKVLGHTSLRQTVRYARTLNKDVMSAFGKLEGKM